jgi:hypothetical protein
MGEISRDALIICNHNSGSFDRSANGSHGAPGAVRILNVSAVAVAVLMLCSLIKTPSRSAPSPALKETMLLRVQRKCRASRDSSEFDRGAELRSQPLNWFVLRVVAVIKLTEYYTGVIAEETDNGN